MERSKLFFLTGVLLHCIVLCRGQKTINVTGNSLSVSGFSFEYSVGETVTTTIGANDYYCSQGILQPLSKNIITGLPGINSQSGIKLFQTNHLIKIITSKKITSYQLLDISGKLLMTGNIPANREINIQSFAAGIYLIRIFDSRLMSVTIKFLNP